MPKIVVPLDGMRVCGNQAVFADLICPYSIALCSYFPSFHYALRDCCFLHHLRKTCKKAVLSGLIPSQLPLTIRTSNLHSCCQPESAA